MINNVDSAGPQLVRVSLVDRSSKLLGKISSFFSSLTGKISLLISRLKRRSVTNSFMPSEKVQERSWKKYLPYTILGIFVIAILAIVGTSIFSTFKNFSFGSSGISVLDAKARQELNREFSFPIYDANGKEVNKLKYAIQSAEYRDELIADGKRYKSVKGRTFLVLNLKLTNDYKQSVTINTKDYVRLSANGKDEWASADMHNDPVEVDAIATENTRLAFAVNNSDKNLKLRVGEINGSKDEINLDLK